MDNEDIKRIRSIKIATVLGIKDTGRRVSLKCVFHNEKSASMVIYPDNSFHCFGCGANGQNSIDFIMALGCTFPEALAELDNLS